MHSSGEEAGPSQVPHPIPPPPFHWPCLRTSSLGHSEGMGGEPRGPNPSPLAQDSVALTGHHGSLDGAPPEGRTINP